MRSVISYSFELSGDIGHVLEIFKRDQIRRSGGDISGCAMSLSDGDVAACQPPPRLVGSKEKDWLYSDMMVTSWHEQCCCL